MITIILIWLLFGIISELVGVHKYGYNGTPNAIVVIVFGLLSFIGLIVELIKEKISKTW